VTTVSVVIPAYNQDRFVGESVQSALDQTRRPLEVIVVDDGSTDDTRARLEPFGNRILLVSQANRGVSVARNEGSRRARGTHLAFLDADDAWLPRKLEAQTARLEADPELGLVHCGVEEIDATGRRTGERLDGREGWVADAMLFFGPGVILGGGSGVVLPKHLFREAGGFDERMSTSADWDLHQRIARRARVGFVPEILLRYRRHEGNMHRDVALMAHDMLLAYEKAFRSEPGPPRDLRRRALASLHSMLASSFAEAGQFPEAMRHLARAVVYEPRTLYRALRSIARRLGADPPAR
jgi:glycosyltransferase involved in cell wall biosynthesis